jgi:AcrR family transcriptional regulator
MARTAAEGTRARILQVALRLFYTKGIQAVGLSQIIDAAGCGKNLLYSHFATKDDLVAAYLSAMVDQREREAEAAMAAAGPDPIDQLVALTQDIAGHADQPTFRGCALRNYLGEFPDEDGAPARVALDFLRVTRERVDTLVRRAKVARPAETAERVWLVHDGLYATTARSTVRAKPAVGVQLVRELLEGARRN